MAFLGDLKWESYDTRSPTKSMGVFVDKGSLDEITDRDFRVVLCGARPL